ncbi:MAG: hypothetical protein RBR53_04445 [Desulforegulaceae bacterium]|nr:hypothetical protein [Desulforegulaceae bacterium]
MKKIIALSLFVFIIFANTSYSAPQIIVPGIIVDDLPKMSEPFISLLKKEVKALITDSIVIKD